MIIIYTILGLIVGSFLEAFTSRAPAGELLPKGRSRCPKCKRQIKAQDNIPLLSFILLLGKCRACKKPIPLRCPLIELLTAISFALVFIFQPQIVANIPWLTRLPSLLSVGYLLFVVAILISVLIIDLEHQIILDETTFLALLITFLTLLFFGPAVLYLHLLAGFLAALFLLSIHLLTRGRGMGLGDVKLALFIGTLLGPFGTFAWMFLSFIIGAVFGIILLVANLKKLSDKIAFGPFLVVAFFLYVFFANYFLN